MVFFVFVPFFSVSAQVVISEIMYDPKDADSNAGGEWIEIQNTNSSPLDITKWIFFEADTNHGIVADGISEIPSGAYAVISRDLIAFKNYFTGFSGLLFKASFSLNDGETLAMKADKESAATDSVAYSSDWGAKNDGNSLQKLDGVWVASTPTPGVANSGNSAQTSSESSEVETASDTSSGSQTSSNAGGGSSVVQTIFPDAGPDRTVISGASIVFEGQALGIKKEPILNALYVWNFGDGETAEGKKVSHTYRYPGEHIVVLNVASDERSVGDKAVVTVTESKMAISGILSGQDGYVEILNGSPKEADISWWQISDGVKTFIIPSGTIILPSKKIRLANSVTKLAPSEENIMLYYPSGKVAYQYSNSKPVSVAPTLIPSYSQQKVAIADATKKSIEEISSGFKNAQQAASAAEAASPLLKKSENWKWHIALFGIITLALGGVIFVGGKKKNESGFTIVE